MPRGKSIGSLRNLAQYRGKTDEEIETLIYSGELENQVIERLRKLEGDYDFIDMKHNDMDLLRRMATLMVRLEDAESTLTKRIRNDEIDSAEKLKEEQTLGLMRRDLVMFQDTLGISRGKRVDKVENNPLLLFEDIRKRAAHFLRERLCYIKCPQCNIAIGTVNFLYPDKNNVISLECGKCGTISSFSSKELLEVEEQNPYR